LAVPGLFGGVALVFLVVVVVCSGVGLLVFWSFGLLAFP
jgi:hypothetical protein